MFIFYLYVCYNFDVHIGVQILIPSPVIEGYSTNRTTPFKPVNEIRLNKGTNPSRKLRQLLLAG